MGSRFRAQSRGASREARSLLGARLLNPPVVRAAEPRFDRSKFQQGLTLAPNSADFGDVGQFRTIRAILLRFRPTSGELGHLRAISTKFNSTNFGAISTNHAQFRSNLGRVWPIYCDACLMQGIFERVWAMSTNLGAISNNFGHCFPKFHLHRAEHMPEHCSLVGGRWSEVSPNCLPFVRFWT